MKKNIFFTLVLALSLTVLSACRAGTATTTQASTQPNTTADSIESRLAVGTLLLKDTDLAVTKDEAAELVFLWKAVKTLSSANNAAAEEMQALYDQIQETMTPAQVEAIRAMQMDAEKMSSLRAELGVEMGMGANQGGAAATGSRSSSGGGMGMPGGGPGGAGGPPMGDPGMMAGGAMPAEMQTQAAGQTGGQAARGAGLMFVEPLIKYLNEVASS